MVVKRRGCAVANCSNGDSKWVLGIDEAGRGSLVGEMMVAGYALKQEDVDLLEMMGVKDSKELTPSQRRELYQKLIDISNVFVVIPVPPQRIDRENINVLTERAALEIVKVVSRRICGIEKLSAVYVDKFGRLRSFPRALRKMGFDGILIVEEKADAKYKIVSAASIIAKYVRDKRIRVLSKLYGVRGSGYPSDPSTVSWVKEVVSRGEHLPIIRYSWSTLKDLGYGKKFSSSKKTLLDFIQGDG
jgi:ribonuclease HII